MIKNIINFIFNIFIISLLFSFILFLLQSCFNCIKLEFVNANNFIIAFINPDKSAEYNISGILYIKLN